MSARKLTYQTMDKAVNGSHPPALGPNEMRLYSYYRPGLQAGNYQITAIQTVISETPTWGQQTLTIKNTTLRDPKGVDAPQEFEVVVPRFSLDPNLINSYYPPDGHQDEGRVLPHIVLNDPHYPWEVPAGINPRFSRAIDPFKVVDLAGNNIVAPDDPYIALDENNKPIESSVCRNMVPWIALLVFDPKDLRLDSLQDLQNTGLFNDPKPADLLAQNPKGTFTRTVKEYLTLPTRNRTKYEADDSMFSELKELTNNVDLIFLRKNLFKQVFAYSQNDSEPPITGSQADLKALEAHKYLAHVRQLNTTGFPDAGVEEIGLFSIVVSSRLGAYDISQPQTQICHLVSIEHVDSTLQEMADTGGDERIGMVSLFSWIYTALPPNPVNFVATVRNLVSHQQMLSIDQRRLKQLLDDIKQPTEASKILVERLRQGYTLARWRAPSGELTTAYSRGPLIPGPVANPVASDIPDCSNTSQSYQILDPETGMMDLSYSSAWQLGKTLALSDTNFSSALMRFRSIVYNSSVQQTQKIIHRVVSPGDLMKAMAPIIQTLGQFSTRTESTPNRVVSGIEKVMAPILQDPSTTPVLHAHLLESVIANASAGTNPATRETYNEFNSKQINNSDWAVIHTWMCEKLSLGGIPPQYLLPEPAFLPPESLRFFHIDDFWLDCFLDGALSVANHLDSEDDTIRRHMKSIFNEYLKQNVSKAGYRPQIPSGGFIIRSQLIKAMPDLRITVEWKAISGSDNRAPVCRWTKWDSETLMCLLDRDLNELNTIILAQPPHQQRFSLGSYVQKGEQPSKNVIEFNLRTLYTSEKPSGPENPLNPWQPDFPTGEWDEKRMKGTLKPVEWLNFETRVMKVPKMATEINQSLQFAPNPADQSHPTSRYRDTVPNSCEFGLELNDPSYYFVIVPKNRVTPTLSSQRLRQLYISKFPVDSITDAKAAFEKAMESRAGIMPVDPTTDKMPTPPSQPLAVSPVSNSDASKSANPPSTDTRVETLNPARSFNNFNGVRGPITASTIFNRMTIHADYKSSPPLPRNTTIFDLNDYVPDRNIYFYDLIFTLSKTVPMPQNLLRVDIDIPMMPPAGVRPTKEPLLEGDYYGPGVRMLSNQRFIPFMFFQPPPPTPAGANSTLHIELRPRSTDDDYALPCTDARTNDLSFRLAEAPISRVAVPTKTNIGGREDNTIGRAEVWLTEWYSTPTYPLGEPVRARAPYVVLKRQLNEDKDWEEFGPT